MTATSTLNQQPLIGTTERLVHYALRNELSSNCETQNNTALSEGLQAKYVNAQNLDGAVQYKTSSDRESQNEDLLRRKKDASAQLKNYLSEEVAIFAQCHAYKKLSVDMLS